MNNQKNKSIIAIVILTILSLSLGSAYASPATSLPPQASDVLEQIAGINIKECKIITLKVSTSNLPQTNETFTDISGSITYQGTNYSLAISFREGKLWHYSLTAYLTDPYEGFKVNPNDCATIAKNALNRYSTNYNASYYGSFTQMIPSTFEAQNTTIEKDNISLDISHYDSATSLDYIRLQWFKKVNDNKLDFISTSMIIAKNGLVIYFIDNLPFYSVATTEVNVSEKQAIDIAMPYIKAYTEENNRDIVSITAEIKYWKDNTAIRGNSNLIYPQWYVTAVFDDSNKSIRGYETLIWADTGEAYYHEPAGMFVSTTESAPLDIFYMLIIVITTAVIAFIGIALRKKLRQTKRQTKNQFLENIVKSVAKNNRIKICSILAASLLCALYIPISYADTSFGFAAHYQVSSNEIGRENALLDFIRITAQNVGYSTYTWNGSTCTDDNMAISAYGNYDDFSSTYYIGHGSAYETAYYHYWLAPPLYHYHLYSCVAEYGGTHAKNDYIYSNSYSQNPGDHKVVVLWACHSAEGPNGNYQYMCGISEPEGLSYAWNHVVLGTDGYNNPDSSGQVFIGFTGYAPVLEYEGFGQNALNTFLQYFYWYALNGTYDVKDSLDQASSLTWACSLSATELFNGYEILGKDPGQMHVWGQSTISM
jgi:hypothetical protein